MVETVSANQSKIVKRKVQSIVKPFRLIDFHVFDQKNTDDFENKDKFQKKQDDMQFTIQMFGVNEKGETCCIFIDDYEPFFFIKVGYDWDKSKAYSLLKYIRDSIDERYRPSILDCQLVEYNKLYGFTAGKKDKFVKLIFKNTIVMNKVKSLWYEYVSSNTDSTIRDRKPTNVTYYGVKLELYESNIPPLLRYFHIYNISPSGWVSVQINKCKKPETKITTCTFEYICNLNHVKPLPDKEDRVPYKICSFDIEASSSHGDFPVPIKTYKRLASNIVDIFIKQLQFLNPQNSKQLLEKIILTAFGYSNVEDVDIVYPKTTPSKDYLKSFIQILINESMEKAKKANTQEDNSDLLTIDTMFEQMKEYQLQTGNGDDDGGGDDEESGEKEPIAEVSYSYKPKTKKTKVEKNASIIDILLSSNYDRDEKIQIANEVLTRLFPRLEGDKVTFIGSTFMRYGESDTYLNHCLVLGTCDEIDNAVIETAVDEEELLLKWTELIQNENPDIIIGYNIFGFDYEFMFRRAQENHCENQFLLLSRKVGELCATKNKDNVLSIENTKLAIASGEYDLRFFKMTGRLQVDMYAYFRRDFNLSSYKLDDVAGQFISDDVKK